MNRRLLTAFILLIFPTLVLGLIILKNQLGISSAKTWRIEIVGYDPRDLLYGHYLLFRFNWASVEKGSSCSIEEECCLCLEKNGEKLASFATKISYKKCEEAKLCTSYIRSVMPPDSLYMVNHQFGHESYNIRFYPERSHKYFIPEKYANELEGILRKREHQMAIDLKVTPSGHYIFGELYINGEPWREWFSRNNSKSKY